MLSVDNFDVLIYNIIMNKRRASDQPEDAQTKDQTSPQPGNQEAEQRKILEALLIETLTVQLLGYLEGTFLGSFVSTDFSFDAIHKVFVDRPDYTSDRFLAAFSRLLEQKKIVRVRSAAGAEQRFKVAPKKNRF